MLPRKISLLPCFTSTTHLNLRLLQALWENTALKYYMKPFLHKPQGTAVQFDIIQRISSSSLKFWPFPSNGGSRGGACPPPPFLFFRPNWGPKGEKKIFGDCTPPPPPSPQCQGVDPALPSVNFSQCAVHDYCYLGWMPWALYHAISSDRSCSQEQLCLWWSCAPNIHLFHSTGNFPAISDDLVNSYHLLLCCLDLLYSNALYTKNRQNLLNPNFEGNF